MLSTFDSLAVVVFCISCWFCSLPTHLVVCLSFVILRLLAQLVVCLPFLCFVDAFCFFLSTSSCLLLMFICLNGHLSFRVSLGHFKKFCISAFFIYCMIAFGCATRSWGWWCVVRSSSAFFAGFTPMICCLANVFYFVPRRICV